MEIKIHEDVKNKLSDDEYKYLLLLEFFDDFISEIERLQKLVKESEIYLVLPLLPPIMEKYHVPINFKDPIESLIEYGEIFQCSDPIDIIDIRFQVNRRMLYNDDLRIYSPPNKLMSKEKWNSWYENNKRITKAKGIEFALPLIKLNRRMNKSELCKQIKLKWKEIEEAFKHYEKSDDLLIQLKHISFKDINRMIKIYRLRKQKIPMKYRDISIKFNFEENTMIKYYDRMKDLLINLGFIKK